MSSRNDQSPRKLHNPLHPSNLATTSRLPPAEALKSLDLYARATLHTLRSVHLEYAHVFHKICLHEPASRRTARLYRALAGDPVRAAGHRGYQQCRQAMPAIRGDLHELLERFEETRGYVFAVAKGVGEFEAGLTPTGPPGGSLGGRLARVKGLVEDAVAKMEMMALAERAVAGRFGRLAGLVSASHGEDVKEEVGRLLGLLVGILGPEMEMVD